jgi:alcohol dehydrogenase class IV
MHGESLAVTYPEFTRFTYSHSLERFAAVGHIFDPSLKQLSKEQAAAGSREAIDSFLKSVGMWLSLKGLGATTKDVAAIAHNSWALPDYKCNPRSASRDQIYEILMRSFERE